MISSLRSRFNGWAMPLAALAGLGACSASETDSAPSSASGRGYGGGANNPGAQNADGRQGSSSAPTSNTAVNGADRSTSFTTTDGSAPFKGLGNSWRALSTGCGPDTASQCGGVCEANPATSKVQRAPAVFCFGADPAGKLSDPTPNDPAAMIEQVIETVNGVSYVHVRVTFDPAFVDNTYGVNSIGWGTKGHTFDDQLTNSDHIELLFTDASGATAMDLKEDYIHSLIAKNKGPGAAKPGKATGAAGASSVVATSTTTAGAAALACPYANLGVTGGDGSVVVGTASDVLAATSSITRNINGCGYCSSAACGPAGSTTGNCTEDSPLTDDKYTPNPLTPNWNYAVVYELWLRAGAFDAGGGYGQAYITFVHASPSKIGENTLTVVPTPCPPTWVSCPPGQACPPNPPGSSTGAGGTGNVPSSPGCPINYQVYITLEGASTCTPIPFSGWPDRSPCPAGYKYTIDTSNESQYCLPG